MFLSMWKLHFNIDFWNIYSGRNAIHHKKINLAMLNIEWWITFKGEFLKTYSAVLRHGYQSEKIYLIHFSRVAL